MFNSGNSERTRVKGRRQDTHPMQSPVPDVHDIGCERDQCHVMREPVPKHCRCVWRGQRLVHKRSQQATGHILIAYLSIRFQFSDGILRTCTHELESVRDSLGAGSTRLTVRIQHIRHRDVAAVVFKQAHAGRQRHDHRHLHTQGGEGHTNTNTCVNTRTGTKRGNNCTYTLKIQCTHTYAHTHTTHTPTQAVYLQFESS